ncbi:MAG: hypothetical protein PHD05_07135, partial [Sphaerochaetaceae bacterium]|nr:hypothetical protein [Sphaerochaetaceae bacterium]
AMGIMNENVYGLEPNLEAVDDALEEATSGVTVTVDGDGRTTAGELVVPGGSSLAEEVGLTSGELGGAGLEGDDVADLDFSEENAAKVHEGVAAVVNSPEAKAAFIEKLKEPVADTNPEAVSNALKIEKAKIKKLAASLALEGSTSGTILDSINSIVIPGTPTKGDMMVVQVLGNLAKKTSDRAGILTTGSDAEKQAAEEEILEEAFKTLETLKTIGKASSIDLIDIFNINALLSRSTSRDTAEDTFLDAIKDSVSSLIDEIVILSGIPADDNITEDNVGSMINEFTGLRVSYEMAAFSKNPVSWVSGADNATKLLNYDGFVKNDDGEMELQDMLLYGISVGITDLYERIGAEAFVEFLNALIDNKEVLQEAILEGKDLTNLTEDDDPGLITVVNAFASIQTAYKDAFEDKEEADVKKAFSVANTLLYLKWESGTDTPWDSDIEENLDDLFGGKNE